MLKNNVVQEKFVLFKTVMSYVPIRSLYKLKNKILFVQNLSFFLNLEFLLMLNKVSTIF